jgi:hypothetical protein
MLGLPLAFTAPAVLVALVGLAALYLFLRITPPRPREVRFPPLRLLFDLVPKDQSPARTPWPLLALRLAVAAAIILAMAGPIWNPLGASSAGSGPLLVLLDDGWPSAPTFEQRIALAIERVQGAERAGRLSAIVAFSDGARQVTPLDGARAIDRLRALQPRASAPDRMIALPAIRDFLAANPKADVVWIADGLELGGANSFAAALAKTAAGHDGVVLLDATTARGLTDLDNPAAGLSVRVLRAGDGGAPKGVVQALDAKGLTIGETPFDFGAGRAAVAQFNLPAELRNDVNRLVIAGEHSAGAVALLDERFRRRRVAIASGAGAEAAQPLLSPTFYLNRALAPFADVREPHEGAADPIQALLADKPSVLALADMSVPAGAAHDALAKFVDDGGVLVRFAGTRLAASSDDLIPTPLRRGGRTLGGALSWETPKRLAPFDDSSPFAGLPTPSEVTVSRQVLAEPEPGLVDKTWARLADGTPLVTAARRGKGLIVLFHVTADTTWSNLPLSGLFVDMLRRIVALAGQPAPEAAATSAAKTSVTHAPLRNLDGYGALGPPPAWARPIPAGFSGVADADHPPGFYGQADAPIAVNTLAPGQDLKPADYAGLKTAVAALSARPLDLRLWLLLAAFAGFLADAVASLWLGGGGVRLRGAVATGVTGLVVLAALAAPLPGGRAFAAEAIAPPVSVAPPTVSKRDQDAALETHLAYIKTGDSRVDETSRLGLVGLTRILTQRTSLSPGDPIGLDPLHDELSFYPLIYWPIVADAPQPPAEAVSRIAAFMKGGGTMVFDTRDALNARPGGPQTPEGRWLQRLLAGVDVPELEPVPRDHVITKTFYLIDGFIGRTDMGQTWIEALPPPDPSDTAVRPARAGDSVSSIVVTSNDLAAAWASDENGMPMYALIPGGARQRELALRGGVNLVMYTLTGNYKADQVHARDLIERLSH